eukprot:1194302-Prorocentrum_minimum.AAC.9
MHRRTRGLACQPRKLTPGGGHSPYLSCSAVGAAWEAEGGALGPAVVCTAGGTGRLGLVAAGGGLRIAACRAIKPVM